MNPRIKRYLRLKAAAAKALQNAPPIIETIPAEKPKIKKVPSKKAPTKKRVTSNEATKKSKIKKSSNE
jgi:hypothetical protein